MIVTQKNAAQEYISFYQKKRLKIISIDEVEKLGKKHKYLYRLYGLTYPEYQELLLQQNDVCAICKTLPPSRRLCVDHIHKKGFVNMPPEEKKKYVRGLVCFICNTLIGKFERTNNVELNRRRLYNVLEYFVKYPMKGEI